MASTPSSDCVFPDGDGPRDIHHRTLHLLRYRIVPARSQLWAEARSSVHPIRVETAGFEGYLSAEVENGHATVGVPSRIELPAGRLKSGNGLLDSELARRIELDKYPRIVGEVIEVTPEKVKGELSFHGVTHAVEGRVTVRVLDDQTLELEGELTIDMRDFGLNPPKILFLRVEPEVRVRAKVVAVREDETKM